MRALPVIALIALASPAAAQQTTYCNPVGRTVICNTYGAPAAAPAPTSYPMPAYTGPSRPWPWTKETRAQRRVEAFMLDPAHQYYGYVRDDMAARLRSGEASTLQQAYDQAVASSRLVQSIIADRR